ncbi:MAG: rod-binding protein [Bdellovibrionales bacterium]|nr:rod-binding protein [Bdellovibrionales bacterium]
MKKLDDKLKHAAKLYEKQFLREMIKAMRNSVSHSDLMKPSMAENIYREQLDQEYVEAWGDRGGVGFADMVYNELVEKFYPQLGGAHKPKPMRPINLSDRYQGISRSLSHPKENKHVFHVQMGESAQKSYLNLPWQGKLEKQFDLENGQKVAMFSHPFGLTSTFVFKGQLQPGLLDKSLTAGSPFAEMAGNSQSITWQVQSMDSHKAASVKENKGFR